jgi:hypothetical protein
MVVLAYNEKKKIYIVIMIRELYSENWNTIEEIVKSVPELEAIIHAKLEKDVDEIYNEALDEYLKY